jgi:hypothetical protein
MDRRAFLGTLAGGLLAAPHAAEAQQAGTVSRIDALGGSLLCEGKNLRPGRPLHTSFAPTR